MNREQLHRKALDAAGQCLEGKGYVSMVDVFMNMGLLSPADLERWRTRNIPYLELAIRGTLPGIGSVVRAVAENSRRGNLKASWTAYMSWGKGPRVPLRFSKSGDPNLERAYATHWL